MSSIVDIYTVGGAWVGHEHSSEDIVVGAPRIGFSPGIDDGDDTPVLGVCDGGAIASS